MSHGITKKMSELILDFQPRYYAPPNIRKAVAKNTDAGLVFPIIEKEGKLVVLDYEAEFLVAKEVGVTHVQVRYVNHEDLMAFRLDRLRKEIANRPNPLDTAAYLAEVKTSYALTDTDLANRLYVSRSEITKYVAIHEYLCPQAKEVYRDCIQFCSENPTDYGHTRFYKASEKIGKEHLYAITQIKPTNENQIDPETQTELQARVLKELCERHLSVKELEKKIHELIKTYKPKPEIVPQDHKSIVYAGDNRHLLTVLEPESVDLLLTSPPFGFVRAKYDTAQSPPQLLDQIVPGLQKSAIALKPGAHAFINIANWYHNGRTINIVADLEYALYEVGLRYFEEITWDKGYLKTRDTSPKSQTHTMYSLLPNTELLLHFVKDGPPRKISTEDSENAKREIHEAIEVNGRLRSEWSENFRRSIYFQPSHKHVHDEHQQGDVGRCSMPDSMGSWYIRAYSFPNDLVLDPFAGTCTSLRMAEKNKRRGIGFEVNPNQIALLEEQGFNVLPVPNVLPDNELPCRWREIVRLKQEAGFYENASLSEFKKAA